MVACAGGAGVSRDRLVALLWPEAETDRARHLLSNSLYVLRQALGDDALLVGPDVVRLNPELVSCDVRQFTDALSRGELEVAVDAYGGPLLDGFFLSGSPEFERWLDAERRRLSDAYAHALEALAEAAEAARDHVRATSWWKARAAVDPCDSRVALRVMRALDAGGNAAGALQFASLHHRLLEAELGIAPPAELEAFAHRLRSRPPARSPEIAHEPPPHSAAAPLTTHPPSRGNQGADTSNLELRAAVDAHGAAAPRSDASAPSMPRRRRARWPFAAAMLLLVGGIVGALWAARPRSTASDPERSLVVLPFVNMSADAGTEYFSDGLTEELITRLAGIPALKVISRTSAMHYKGSREPLRRIAAELKVAHVVEGSVRRAEGRLRVTAQLIDARTDLNRWSESYDVELRDAVQVQERIAREVVRALRVQLGQRGEQVIARRGTRDPEAYDLYRRGRYFWGLRTPDGHAKAVAYYGQAIARDSGYADVYAGLADAYLTDYQHSVSGRSEEEARARHQWAAQRALSLDEQSADARVAHAVSLWWRRDWPGAERELRRALEMNPGDARTHNWYGLLLLGMGRLDEAMRVSSRAVELDPFAPNFADTYAWHLHFAGEDRRAVDLLQKVIEIHPKYPNAYRTLGMVRSRQGMHEDAARQIRTALAIAPTRRDYLGDLAYVLARAGATQEARAVLRNASERPGEAFDIARAWIALGQPDSAFAWLDRSSWHWPHRAARSDPALAPLRRDPRFARLSGRIEREMGLR